MKTLKDAPVGKTVTVVKLHGDGAVRRHIMDMGITKGCQVLVRKMAPLGDPMEVRVRDYALSLRKADAGMIEVEPLEAGGCGGCGKCCGMQPRPACRTEKACGHIYFCLKVRKYKQINGREFYGNQNRACRKSEQRQNDDVQCSDGGLAVCGQLAGGYGGKEGRESEGRSGGPGG